MEYLAIIGVPLLLWLPLYVAALVAKFSHLEIPRKFLFCIVCLIIAYGTLGIVFPVVALLNLISSFLLYDWIKLGYKSLAGFFIYFEEISTYIVLTFPLIASFIVPAKLAPKWQGLVETYS
ncbi:hypothetical protein [Pseudoalteromonas rubra]|uniref:hypothetical protein n=1 Tax=Pseudoalteromonas rubra TaxID=43658 RepID=UPI00026C9020|nr:hypothetical protein [Pseudoalteromonas rubra]